MIFKWKCPIPGCGKICDSETHLKKHMKQFHDLSVEAQLPGTIEEQVQKLKDSSGNPGKIEIIDRLKINLNYHVFISGQTGTGKSVAGKFIFASLPEKTHAIFVDIKHDPSHENFISHFKVYSELSEIKEHFKNNSIGIFSRHQKDMRVIYRPKRIRNISSKTHSLDNPNWEMFNNLCEYAFNKGNIILFIDESAVFSTPSSIVPVMYDILIMGRSRGVIMVNISQRPSIIHNSLISESYTRYLFRQELESDRIKLKGIVGDEVANQLHSLDNQIFIISHVNGNWSKGHINIPKKVSWII